MAKKRTYQKYQADNWRSEEAVQQRAQQIEESTRGERWVQNTQARIGIKALQGLWKKFMVSKKPNKGRGSSAGTMVPMRMED